MTNPLIITAKTDVVLSPAPIEPSWVHEGNPTASNAVLAVSADGTASTIIWQCTPGKFEWHYDTDETIYFLEGSVVISAQGMAPKRMGPGEVLYFKKGAVAQWHIEKQIKKLAFFRRTVPGPIGFAIRVMNKLMRAKAQSGGASTRMMDAKPSAAL